MDKLGLVLEGGGSKGAYQMGAYKALLEQGIEVQGVSGTSIGALNGAMIVQGEHEKAYEMWREIRPSKVFNVDDNHLKRLIDFDLDEESLSYALRKLREIMENKGLDTSLMKKMIREAVDETRLRQSPMDFGLVTVSLTDLKPLELLKEEIPQGKLHDYLMASASVPIFQLEKIDSKVFVDGAFHDNMPINLLARKGYRRMIVIRSFGMGRVQKVDHEKLDITYITPSAHLGRTMDFNNEKARRNLKMGYYDTLRLFRPYKGEMYCIDQKAGEDWYMDFFRRLDESAVRRMGAVFGIADIPLRRMLFEHIIPRMAAVLDLKDAATYEEIFIRFLERQAQACGVDRFAVYKVEDLFEAVLEGCKPRKATYFNKLPDFVKQSELLMLSKGVKDEIMAEFMSIFADQGERNADLIRFNTAG